jgi:hypothetical protein
MSCVAVYTPQCSRNMDCEVHPLIGRKWLCGHFWHVFSPRGSESCYVFVGISGTCLPLKGQNPVMCLWAFLAHVCPSRVRILLCVCGHFWHVFAPQGSEYCYVFVGISGTCSPHEGQNAVINISVIIQHFSQLNGHIPKRLQTTC